MAPDFGINFDDNDLLGGLNNSGLLDDDILDNSGDDLMDIEQTAFMGSSKVMLNMIDTMLKTIDSRIEGVMIHNTPATNLEMKQEAMKVQ